MAAALTAEGYAAKVAPAGNAGQGSQICQHHCPVAHVAAEFPQLCEAETRALAAVLGTNVQRLATIAHGDGVCTTHVSTAAVPPASPTATTTTEPTATKRNAAHPAPPTTPAGRSAAVRSGRQIDDHRS